MSLLEVDGLAVVERGRRLLAASSFRLEEGQRALIVGPSGSGKSLFVDLLLGFAGHDTPGLTLGGSIRLAGEERLGRAPDTAVGAVFQVHRPGVFDDLSIRQNLRFGSRDEAEVGAEAARLGLEGLERAAGTSSGGEQVRTVLGRTLLDGKDVLVFDEPTAGLDAASSEQVVRAIDDSHRRLTIVVTHDYEAFRDFADVVLFLDPHSRTIRPVGADASSIEAVKTALRSAAPAPEPVAARPVGLPARAGRRVLGWADALVDRAADLGTALLAPLAWFRVAHALDGPRVRTALRRDLAPGVALFVAISVALVAVTSTYFLFERLPKRPYAEALFLDDLLAGLGVVQVRVVVPILVSMLLAAKLGASTAAWLGHMSLTRQVDALRLLGISPRRHLLLPAAAGQLVASWLHTLVALVVAFLASVVVFLWDHPSWSGIFAWRAWMKEVNLPTDLVWVAAKVGLSALAVSAVAYRAGTRPKRRPEQVVAGLHETLLQGLIAVLLVHAGFAFLEFT